MYLSSLSSAICVLGEKRRYKQIRGPPLVNFSKKKKQTYNTRQLNKQKKTQASLRTTGFEPLNRQSLLPAWGHHKPKKTKDEKKKTQALTLATTGVHPMNCTVTCPHPPLPPPTCHLNFPLLRPPSPPSYLQFILPTSMSSL
jgi:hypothetical protein